MKFKDLSLKEKLINIALNFLIFIFSIVLIISVYNTIQLKLFKNDYSSFFGYSVFEVQTNSMADEINSGDWIIVKITDKIKLKDVITFKKDGEFITHRVIEKYNGTYITKGDANNSKDDPVDQKQIVGKVVKILPAFGFLRKTLFNKGVLIALIVTLFIINIMFNDKKQVIKKDEKFDDENKEIDNSLEEEFEEIQNNEVEIETHEEENDVEESEDEQIEEEKVEIDEEPESKETYVEEDVDPEDIIVVTDLEREIDSLQKQVVKEEEPEEEIIIENNIYNEQSAMITVDTTSMDEEFDELRENRKILRAEEEEEERRILEEKQKAKDLEEEQKRKEELEKQALEDERLTKITLEKLKEKRKSKKFKNVIEKIMFVKSEELNEYIDLITEDEKQLVNEPTIKSEIIKAYIDSKFYNEGEILNSSNVENIERIKKYVANYGKNLISNYHGQDREYEYKVVKYLSIFKLIINLECTDYTEMQPEQIKEHYHNEIINFGKEHEWNEQRINKTIVNIKKIQKKYINVIELLLKNLETDMFVLNFNAFKFNKRIYGLNLEHNIKFNKIYNENVIDEMYTTGIIAEDKMVVLINLLLMKLIKDMILTNFNKKYVMYLPDTLYKKKTKFDSILKMIDDKYAKENTIILIKYNVLVEYKELIKKKKLNGYKFAILIDGDIENKSGFKSNIYLGDYVFVIPDKVNVDEIKNMFPEDHLDKLVLEDISEIVGDIKEGDK